MGKIQDESANQKETGEVILLSGKADFRTMSTTRDIEKHYIKRKG